MQSSEKQFNQSKPLEEVNETSASKEGKSQPAVKAGDLVVRKVQEQQDRQKIQELHEQLAIGEKKEVEDFFEKLKRPYGVEDVKNLQQALLEFEERREKENGKYVFDYNNFYQFLTSFHKKESQVEIPDEKEIPVKDYQELELGIFQGWRQNLLQNREQVLQKRPKLAEVIKTLQTEPPPKNLDELRDLYRRYPLLNDMSAVSYQEGVGEKLEKRSSFLHINMARYYAYEYEMPEADTRIYLNPPVEAIPKLSMYLVGLAEKEKIPLYFKIIDYSFQKLTPEKAGRLDKMLVYTDKENTPRLAKIIEELQTKRPQWFQGRELPNLVAPIGEGVGIASEPTEFQKQKFGERGKSFNSVRALFLREVWKDTTKGILLANRNLKPRGGRTLQQIFNDQLKLSVDYLELDSGTITQYIEQLWKSGFDTEKIELAAKKTIEQNLGSALLRTMQDVMPNFTPDSLVGWVNRRIQEKALQYGINPDNVAFNL